MSKIEWTQKTWNPLTGCFKVSEGCTNCYAIKQAFRLMHMPHSKEKYAGTVTKTAGGKLNWTGKINLDEKSLSEPLNVKKPTVWFVNSMSDLFHKDVPFDFVDSVFAVMSACPQHTFQILTKRPERMIQYFKRVQQGATGWCMSYLYYQDKGNMQMYEACKQAFEDISQKKQWPLPNVWLGVSVENQKAAEERIPLLLQVPAAVRWLSCEPLLGPVDISRYLMPAGVHHHPDNDLSGGIGVALNALISKVNPNLTKFLHWVVAGGESGHDARPMHPDWARSLRDQCKAAGIPFFFKQWGQWCPQSEALKTTPPYTALINMGYKECFVWQDGKVTDECTYSDIDNDRCEKMYRCGKKESGRLLDGVLHDEYPVLQNS